MLPFPFGDAVCLSARRPFSLIELVLCVKRTLYLFVSEWPLSRVRDEEAQRQGGVIAGLATYEFETKPMRHSDVGIGVRAWHGKQRARD